MNPFLELGKLRHREIELAQGYRAGKKLRSESLSWALVELAFYPSILEAEAGYTAKPCLG